MRYFERQALDTNIQHQLNEKQSINWNSLTDAQRKEIRLKLHVSQQSLCAYCECIIKNIQIDDVKSKDADEYDRDIKMASHIEHFVERHDDSTKIFDYANMLLSCEGDKMPLKKTFETTTTTAYRRDNISCGNGKEKSRHKDIEINYKLLLNPTTNNVSTLFSYTDGFIEPSDVCTLEQINQVKYTVKRLNLDTIRLENLRIRKVREIRIQLKDLTILQQKAFVQDLLDEKKTDLEPFISTIKDNFSFLLAIE